MDSFTAADLEIALEELAMLRYFPTDDGAKAAVMRLLARMVPSREALVWLVRAMADRVGEWKGPLELRAVLCTRWKPADGIEAWSSLPGFRPEDSEQANLLEHEQHKAGWIEAGDAQIPALRRLIAGKTKEVQ